MSFFKRLFQRLGFSKKKVKVLVVGLDNSGKSTILNRMKPKKAALQEVVPTVGFHVEEFTKNNVSFTAFDMSGQGRYRKLWSLYYQEAQALVFVIDASDKIRMCVVKDELEALLSHPDIRARRLPILFFANKMDVPGALAPVDCCQLLELDNVTDHAYHITASNAMSGEGLDDGFQWLAQQIADVLRQKIAYEHDLEHQAHEQHMTRIQSGQAKTSVGREIERPLPHINPSAGTRKERMRKEEQQRLAEENAKLLYRLESINFASAARAQSVPRSATATRAPPQTELTSTDGDGDEGAADTEHAVSVSPTRARVAGVTGTRRTRAAGASPAASSAGALDGTLNSTGSGGGGASMHSSAQARALERRRLQQDRINRENQLLLARLENARSTFDKREFARHEQQHRQLVAMHKANSEAAIIRPRSRSAAHRSGSQQQLTQQQQQQQQPLSPEALGARVFGDWSPAVGAGVPPVARDRAAYNVLTGENDSYRPPPAALPRKQRYVMTFAEQLEALRTRVRQELQQQGHAMRTLPSEDGFIEEARPRSQAMPRDVSGAAVGAAAASSAAEI